MQPFLDQLAGHIIDSYYGNLKDICIILPNRRAGLFFKKHLANRLNKAFWAPGIYAIEDFMDEVSGLAPADQVTLLMELFEAHRELSGQSTYTLDQFLGIGKIMISDFNDIDLYLADPVQVFTFLSDAKALSLWNLDGKELTEFQKKYLLFFRNLKEYYATFNRRLAERGISYQGLAYKKALLDIDAYLERERWQQVVFAGFNALSLAEESLIKHLLRTGKATVFWDADRYYTDDTGQEAGRFLRRYFNGWSRDSQSWTGKYLLESPKTIRISGTSGNVAQARYAGTILEREFHDKPEYDKTAIVLSDENLLVPLLNSIPEGTGEMNVTMGYPVKLTSLAGFLKAIFQMKEAPDGKGRKSFYVPDVLRVLQHPYLSFQLSLDENASDNTGILNGAVRLLIKSKQVFYGPADLQEKLPMRGETPLSIINKIFLPWNDGHGAVNGLTGLAGDFRQLLLRGQQPGNKLETEYLFEVSRILKKLRGFRSLNEELRNIKTLRKIFNLYIDNVKIPFYGEPLKGIQIMGMLETRALDFENIIILSVNENVLPAGRSFNSFIPFDIRRQFNIPTFRDKDAIFAYHFYRLMQRAKNVHIVYNTEGDEFGKGEKSRFISQLMMELPGRNPLVHIEERIISLSPETGKKEQDIVIRKQGYVLELLKERAKKGFSASSLSTWINCTLQFYFKYLIGLSEDEEVEETIQGKTLGQVVHSALQEYYGDYIGKPLSAGDLNPELRTLEQYVQDAFRKAYPGGDTSSGLNLLIARLAVIFFRNFIRHERNTLSQNPELQIVIRSLEEGVRMTIPLTDNALVDSTALYGVIDRVDEIDGMYRITDYKTAGVEKRELKFESIDELLSSPDKKYPFQLMVYALLYRRVKNIPPDKILATLFSLRKPGNGMIKLESQMSMDECLSGFEEGLTRLLSGLLSENGSFQKAEDVKRCEFCDFRAICNR